jgi:hypothetical protein
VGAYIDAAVGRVDRYPMDMADVGGPLQVDGLPSSQDVGGLEKQQGSGKEQRDRCYKNKRVTAASNGGCFAILSRGSTHNSEALHQTPIPASHPA